MSDMPVPGALFPVLIPPSARLVAGPGPHPWPADAPYQQG